jgi:uncharacterized membrane-anchored protein
MTERSRSLVGIIAVGVLQTLVLAYMVGDRVRLLSRGREIVLPIVPVDPRDLFRGEYIRLGYNISRLDAGLLEGPAPQKTPFFVTLERRPDETWLPVRISASRPSVSGPDHIVLAARTMGSRRAAFETWSGTVWVRYGIESYFVPEGEGRELEKLAQDKKMEALVAVDDGGNAAIKGLIIE